MASRRRRHTFPKIVQRLWRLFIRKELLSVFLMVFAADLVTGILSPTFSLYAQGLGASLTLIGLLSSGAGLARILSSVPIGVISDIKGRKGVLMAGILSLGLSAFLYTVVTDPRFLLPMRVLYGMSLTATFFIGMAYVGDTVERSDQGLVSGFYTTFMGLGFTLGSELGGRMAAQLGYVTTFRVAGAIGLAGFLIAWWGIRAPQKGERGPVRTLSPFGRFGILVREPPLLAASVGYLLIILMFDAALSNFFPLYADSLFISQATIGTMFAVRALASTAVRLPTGLLTARVPSRRLMVFALSLGMISIFLVCCLQAPIPLTLLLAGEGIGFGMFLVAGQAFITEHFSESDRGTAMGVYSMTGSIGSMAGPFVFGAVADLWGLRSVFLITAALVLAGIGIFLYASSRRRSPERVVVEPEKPTPFGP